MFHICRHPLAHGHCLKKLGDVKISRYVMIGQSWCHGQSFMYLLRWAGKVVNRLECHTLASLRSWPMMVDCAQIGGLQKEPLASPFAMVMIYRDHHAKIIWCHLWFSHDGVDMITKYNDRIWMDTMSGVWHVMCHFINMLHGCFARHTTKFGCGRSNFQIAKAEFC